MRLRDLLFNVHMTKRHYTKRYSVATSAQDTYRPHSHCPVLEVIVGNLGYHMSHRLTYRPAFMEMTPVPMNHSKPPLAPKKIAKIWETARVPGDAEPVGTVTNGFFDAARSPVHQKLIYKFNKL